MGCCQSRFDREGKFRNDLIDDQIRKDKNNLKNEIKMLLLGKLHEHTYGSYWTVFLIVLVCVGAGESGKSTILKQMKLIHDGGYSEDERMAFREIIYSNAIQSMRVILEARESLGMPLRDQQNRYYADFIMQQPAQIERDFLSSDITNALRALWKDLTIKAVFDRSREYQLNDSAKYYFDSIDRIGERDFLPSNQDVLRSRIKTTGITETCFVIGDLTYRMFDVGGQRSERKKWIHCFESVTAIIFLVAISEYDQTLIEDEAVNRMQEALTLFDSICNSRWFIKTSIILFLNKIDRFQEKLPHSPLAKYFPDFEGDNTYDEASAYILNRFVSLNQSNTKQIYTHFTCATDTKQIKFVMAAVNDIIIQKSLREIGLL